MKRMKKLFAALLCLTMLASTCVFSVFADEAVTSYTADFTNANELDSWTQGANLSAAGTKLNQSYTVSDGALNVYGVNNSYTLPVDAMENFVLEADLTQTSGDNFIGVSFGWDGTSETPAYHWETTVKSVERLYNGTRTTANMIEEISAAYGYNWHVNVPEKSALGQSLNLKVMVYNKKLAVYKNNQLTFTYTLSDYTGGKIGLVSQAWTGVIRSLSVREATASDVILAESFNDDTLTSLTKLHGVTTGNIVPTSGYGKWNDNSAVYGYIDSAKTSTTNHIYNAGFEFRSTTSNTASYITFVCKAVEDTDGNITFYGVKVYYSGRIEFVTHTYTKSTGEISASTAKSNLAAADVLKKLNITTDKLTKETHWDYTHVLNGNNVDIYINDIYIGSFTGNTVKTASESTGYVGILQKLSYPNIHYIDVRPLTSADLNRPSQFTLSYDGVALSDRSVTVYDETGAVYGNTYANASGKFDMHLAHGTKYMIQAVNDNDITVKKEIVYTSYGEPLVVDIEGVEVLGTKTTTQTTGKIIVNDTTKMQSGAKLIVAIYNNNQNELIGIQLIDVTDATEYSFDITHTAEQSSANTITAKVMQFVDMTDIVPVCSAFEVAF